MESLYEIINLYTIEIVFFSSIIALLSLVIMIINFRRTSAVKRKYNKMMRGMDNKNLEYLLLSHMESLEKSNERVKQLDLQVQGISNELEDCIQKAKVIRYNPFDQMGSDQSFSVALVDKHGDGVVLTGLYSRESSTVFAKPLTNYKSKYALSNEEMQVIEKTFKESKV